MYAEPDILTSAIPCPTSDGDLLELLRARDEIAFQSLVERHQNLLVNYTARLLGCRSQAEDVAQETFIRFFRNLGRYREEGNLKAYLLRIATNLVRSRERRNRRWRLLVPAFMDDASAAAGPSPQAEMLADEAYGQLVDAIRGLDLRYRAPLVMREIEGLSYREISVALGVSAGTVKSRLHRARALVKNALAPYLGGNER